MSRRTVTHPTHGWALFLDVDGTLLEIAPVPQDVRVPGSLKRLLSAACARLDGALALVSGRTIADLDALFAPYRFCAAGVHGCERRDASGLLVRPQLDPSRLDVAREELRRVVHAHPELMLEDKGLGLALHFRRAGHLRALAYRTMQALLKSMSEDFALQQGKCVYELRPAGWTKGAAVAAFLRQAPFRGRTPVFIGDDVTDEDAFACINEHRGLSIRVGAHAPTLARYTLAGVAEVIDWLRRIPPIAAPGHLYPDRGNP
jgi:trehalose 6-phosphate phosphatase